MKGPGAGAAVARPAVMLRRVRRGLARSWVILRKLRARVSPSRAVLPFAGFPPARQSVADLVVVVTGSSRGIGRAVAAGFLRSGARVVINGREAVALEEARRTLAGGHGGRVQAVAADASTPEGAHRLIEQAVGRFGGIDVLVNSAGITGAVDARLWELPPGEWRQVMAANVDGPFLCACEAIRHAYMSRRPLRIINVSSGVVGVGAPHLGPYTASKMALEGLTLAIARDADVELVSVVSLRPRSVRTRLTRGYFSTADYELMDDPDVLVPAFLHAATAPAAEVTGRSLSENAFAVDPWGETALNNTLAAARPIRIEPETYRRGIEPPAIERPGAYMHLLENPLDCYPLVARTLAERIESRRLYGYPDPAYPELRAEIAHHLGLRAENVSVAGGSSELIDRAIRTFCPPGMELVITRPTWSFFHAMYPRYGARPVEVPHRGSLKRKDIEHDLERILDTITPWTRLIYLANPCNPTGSMLRADDLGEFLRRIPSHVTVVLDEAYIEFSEPGRRFELAPVLPEIAGRVIATRTFSKFFALAGSRVGYAYGRPEVLDLLERGAVPFAVTAMSEVAARAALRDVEAQKRTWEKNDVERRRLAAELDRLGIGNMPSQTSFILFDCPVDPEAMRRALLARGLVLPNVQQFWRNHVVLPVGLPEHNELVLDYLARL